jgi:hypothetical protein
MTRLALLIVLLAACSGARADPSACELAKGALTQEDLDQNKAVDEGKSFMEQKVEEG